MLSYFLARRFFQSRSSRDQAVTRASAPAIRIATAGIAVGLAVMIVSVCVVKGFQGEVSKKVSGFASHIELSDANYYSSPESRPVVTDTRVMQAVGKIPEVTHVQRVSEKMGIFKTENDFAGISLKGIAQEYDKAFLSSCIVEGSLPDFRDDRASNAIAVSRTLADQLHLKVGDAVYSYFFSNTIRQRRFKIAAIYETHLKQFDKTFVLTDLYTVNKLNAWKPEQSSGLEIQLRDARFIPDAQIRLRQLFAGKKDAYGHEYNALSIYENPRTASVLSWLQLLDLNVLVILIIMIFVAGFTMVSGLLILILERTTTIGLLKALGATNRRVRHTFLWYAALIVGRGLLIGNAIGLLLVGVQACTHIVKLNPETYYIDYAPVEINALWIVGLNVASLFVTMLALVLPSFLVSRVQPAKSLQFD